MIGLQRPNNARAHEDEPAELRDKSKNQIYALLAEEYFLPSVDSKGVNRTYLVGLYRGDHYRVRALDIKRFELELRPMQQKRVSLVNLAYMYRKLNALLLERGEQQLGFPDHAIPEESWLCKIARYVDRKNVLEFFSQAVQQVAPATCLSENVHIARINAHAFVFEGNQLLDQQTVYQAVKEISESYRRIIGKKIDIEEINRSRLDMLGKLNTEEAHLKAALMKASTTIIAVAEDNFDPDRVFNEDEGERNRGQLRDIARL